MSSSNLVSIKYAPEAVYNQVPTAATWKTVRFTSEGLTSSHTNTTSQEIRSDRMTADSVRVSAEVMGDLGIELSALTFDDFIAAAMANDWEVDGAVSTLKIGTDTPSFSIEKHFEDINKYFSFTGLRVGSLNLNVSYGEILTGSISFMGAGAEASTTTVVGTGTVVDATTTDVLNSASDISTISIDGSPTTVCIQSLSLTVDNSLRTRTCIGKVYPTDLIYGTAQVNGTLELYFSATAYAMYQKVLNNSDISFGFKVTDGDYEYEFTIPRAKLTSDAPVAGGLDSDVTMSFEFNGLLDSVTETSLLITKTAL